MDIIFIELAINDQRVEAQAEAYEWLLRALLALPTKPAVIHVQTIGLIFQMLTTGGDLHTAIAQYYDNPIISIRNVLLPHILAQKDPTNVIKHWFGKTSYTSDDPDMRHVRVRCGPRGTTQTNHFRLDWNQRTRHARRSYQRFPSTYQLPDVSQTKTIYWATGAPW